MVRFIEPSLSILFLTWIESKPVSDPNALWRYMSERKMVNQQHQNSFYKNMYGEFSPQKTELLRLNDSPELPGFIKLIPKRKDGIADVISLPKYPSGYAPTKSNDQAKHAAPNPVQLVRPASSQPNFWPKPVVQAQPKPASQAPASNNHYNNGAKAYVKNDALAASIQQILNNFESSEDSRPIYDPVVVVDPGVQDPDPVPVQDPVPVVVVDPGVSGPDPVPVQDPFPVAINDPGVSASQPVQRTGFVSVLIPSVQDGTYPIPANPAFSRFPNSNGEPNGDAQPFSSSSSVQFVEGDDFKSEILKNLD